MPAAHRSPRAFRPPLARVPATLKRALPRGALLALLLAAATPFGAAVAQDTAAPAAAPVPAPASPPAAAPASAAPASASATAAPARPSAEAQLKEAEQRLAKSPHDLDALALRARSLDRLRRYGDALPAYRRWVAALDRAGRANDFALVLPLARIVVLADNADLYAEALAASTRAVRIQRSLKGDTDPETGFLLVGHAIQLRKAGRPQEARPFAQDAVRIAETVHGPQDLETASALHELVRVLSDLADYAEALPLAQRALAIAEKAGGPEHYLTGLLLQRIAELHTSLGEPRLALPLAERSLAVAQAFYGPDSQHTANRMADLADLHEQLGDTARALPLQERALAISEKASGPDDASTASVRYSLATLLIARGEPRQALPHLAKVLATQRRAFGEEHPGTARTLASLAEAHVLLADFRRADPLLRRAVRILERTLGADHPAVASRLAQLASLEEETGRLASAERLYERALAITEQALGRRHGTTVQRRVSLALFHRDRGQYARARGLLTEALEIAEEAYGKDHAEVGRVAGGLATVLDGLGDDGARALHERELAIAEAANGPAHPATAHAASSFADYLQYRGELGPAIALRQRVLAIRRGAFGEDHPSTAEALSDLGMAHEAVGQFDDARASIERALAVTQAAMGGDHPDTARRLNEVGYLHDARGEHAVAITYYRRALAIVETRLGPRHWRVAQLHNNVAFALQRLGRLREAEVPFRRALALVDADAALQDDALLFEGNLARLLGKLGRHAESDALFRRSWQRLAVLGPNPMTTYHLLRKQATAFAGTGRPEAAIFFGKQAVNQLQAVRAQARGMDQKLQQGLAERHQEVYNDLAGWLVGAGRLAEAEQVLGLLKDLELFELTRQSTGTQAVGLAGPEQALDRRFQDLQQGLQQARELEELNRLQKQGTALSPEQQAKRTQLQSAQQAWREAFQRFMAQVQPALSSDPAAAQAARTAAEQATGKLRTLVRAANEQGGARHVALSFLLTDDGVSVIVTTAEGSFARRTAVPVATLNAEVGRLRDLLQAPQLDPRPSAQALYKLLFAPLEQDLATLQPQVLVLNLTGILRYLPFAALHDGNRYLAQRYAFALYTSAGAAPVRAERVEAWSVAGLGLAREVQVGDQTFRGLPSVTGELAGIVRTQATPGGALPGRISLDAQFTRQAFEDTLTSALQGQAPVVHVASHFHLSPGSDEGSYLVLGDATPLRLSEIKELDFRGVQLFALSACNTATVGGLNKNGSEVEGLAAVVQLAGARSVLATLWPVADASTAAFMQRFYTVRTRQASTSHALAIQQAQSALITGTLQVAAGPSTERGVAPPRSLSGAMPFRAPADAPYAHPFYWGPFVLMGNWL